MTKREAPRRPASGPPDDQALRDRFVRDADGNVSVLAPAGVGKTKAIVDRVIAIATGDRERALAWLPRLVVVTYTRKAADEMHQRARNEILKAAPHPAILGRFNRAFFGTIHSFCVTLLRAHGHHLGLPPDLDLVENDEEVWASFVRQTGELAPALPPDVASRCLRHVPAEDVFRLARMAGRDMPRPPAPGPCPAPDLAAALDFVPDRRNEDAVAAGKRTLRAWREEYAEGEGFLDIPACRRGGAAFQDAWRASFAPLGDWLRQAAWAVAWEIAAAYRAYRIEQGLLTYDDQVALALDLLRHPGAGPRMRAEGYRIILDEAQDTDPAQFDVLLELARPPDAAGRWLDGASHPPRAGHFCMVGDPQQSIYGDRADLDHYRRVRDRLRETGAAAELAFEVTFRCDRAIIGFVNAVGPQLLDGEAGQAAFYRLRERPGAGAGQVALWRPPDVPSGEEESLRGVESFTWFEARHLAAWIAEQGLARLQAAAWSEVAVLCPRRSWIGPLEAALADAGLAAQVHSSVSIHGDLPSEAWASALLAVLAAPRNGFEIAGVLREIFGVSDDAMARFCGGDGSRFQIERPSHGRGDVADALNLLAALRAEVLAMPLADAAARALEAVSLRERLVAIGGEPAEVDDRMDTFAALAAAAEARGASLATLAREFRDRFDKPVEARRVERASLQLISCHKAKGLQWDAVILPLFFRPIGMPRSSYPLLVRGGPGQPPGVAFERAHLGGAQEAIERREARELQRLLYVAMTRARHTLVVADDAHLFPRRRNSPSFAELLGLLREMPSRALARAWEGLRKPLAAPRRKAARAPAPAPAKAEPAVTVAVAEAAAEASRSFLRRVLPHALAEQAPGEPESRMDREAPREAAGEAARQYGIWWHELMQSLDWRQAAEDLERAFLRRLAFCPAAARGRREWDLLKASDIVPILAAPGPVVHAEMPILCRRGGSACVEGIIDAAVLRDGPARWLVLDWKTNLVPEDGLQDLARQYAPQLNAYAESLARLTGLPVAAAVFSTALGRWAEVT